MNEQDLDAITIRWTVMDVQIVDSTLDLSQCREVIQLAKNQHDASVGINWDVLSALADEVSAATSK